MEKSIYDITVTTIDHVDKKLSDYRGKVLLIVNTASGCGFTPQLKGLQALYGKYHDRGLEILAFPCNQFAGQEPLDGKGIKDFCEINYRTTFPLFEKIDVKGRDRHPLYTLLTRNAPGLLGSREVKWNFTKFLVDKNGRVVKRFAPVTVPEKIERSIEDLLGQGH